MSPPGPEPHFPPTFPYTPYHPSDAYPHQHPPPYPTQQYFHPPPGPNELTAEYTTQPWIGPIQFHPHPQHLISRPHPGAPIPYPYSNHSSSSSIDHGYGQHHAYPYTYPNFSPHHPLHPPGVINSYVHPNPIHHPPQAQVPVGNLTHTDSLPAPSPLFGVSEVHDRTSISRPPTRTSLGAHSRHTSTSTCTTASAHSGGSEYLPKAVKSAPSKSKAGSGLGAKGKSKVQAVGKVAVQPQPLGPRSRRPPPSRSAVPVEITRPKVKSRPSRKKLTKAPIIERASLTPAPEIPLCSDPNTLAYASRGYDGSDPDAEGSEEESTYPPSNISCQNVTYPILEAPVGTTYSVNNFIILIPANYAPPDTDIVASDFEQYSCRLCRKTYSGKNARSVARRHLQDKHAVRLELQEKRSRWDKNAERPKDDFERDDRNRANKAGWARKHRQAERERIDAALQKDQHNAMTRPKRGPKKQTSILTHVLFSKDSPLFSSDADGDMDEDDDEEDGAGDTSCETTLAILHGSATWSQPANADAGPSTTFARPAEVSRTASYAPTQQTDSPLSSSPDPIELGAQQQWAVPEGWHDMTAHQMISWMTFPPDEGDGDGDDGEAAESGDVDVNLHTDVERGNEMAIDPELRSNPKSSSASSRPNTALAAETLLNLHSSPTRHLPNPNSTPRPTLSRPTPLRRFTHGSSSTYAVMCSSSLSMPPNPYPGWPSSTPQGLETPISLRPPLARGKRPSEIDVEAVATDESERQGVEGRKKPIGRGRLMGGERSLSFSAVIPTGLAKGGDTDDDPFSVSFGGAGGKENTEPVGIGEMVGLWKGEKKAGQDGSPVPYRKRQPLNSILANPPPSSYSQSRTDRTHPTAAISRHHSSSSLSSTLVAPNTHFGQTTISPLKRHGHSATYATPVGRRAGTYRFGQALFGKAPGTVRTSEMRRGSVIGGDDKDEDGGRGTEGSAQRPSRWVLSSPAGNGVAAELGLVGAYGYLGGLETPMRGVVESETPARD